MLREKPNEYKYKRLISFPAFFVFSCVPTHRSGSECNFCCLRDTSDRHVSPWWSCRLCTAGSDWSLHGCCNMRWRLLLLLQKETAQWHRNTIPGRNKQTATESRDLADRPWRIGDRINERNDIPRFFQTSWQIFISCVHVDCFININDFCIAWPVSLHYIVIGSGRAFFFLTYWGNLKRVSVQKTKHYKQILVAWCEVNSQTKIMNLNNTMLSLFSK